MTLVWYENRWIVRSYPMETPLWFSPNNQVKFWVIRLIILIGSLIVIWHQEGIEKTLICFVLYYIFSKITFQIYYKKEINKTTLRYEELIKKKKQDDNEEIDEDSIFQEALRLAEFTVQRNMKGE